MRILVIEDDENKRNQVIGFLKSRFEAMEVSEARSFHSGMCAIAGPSADLIILDMSMPTFDISADEPGGRPQAYAGREILRRMSRQGMATPVVVLTQFDRFGEGLDTLTLEELDQQLMELYPSVYIGAIYYNVTLDGWQDSLARTIEQIEEYGSGQRDQNTHP